MSLQIIITPPYLATFKCHVIQPTFVTEAPLLPLNLSDPEVDANHPLTTQKVPPSECHNVPQRPATPRLQQHSPRTLISYSELRSFAGGQILFQRLLEARVRAGDTFCREVQSMFNTYLHEFDSRYPLESRRGAFGYREVYDIGMEMVARFNALSRYPTVPTREENRSHRRTSKGQGSTPQPPGEIQQFLRRNAQFLANELSHLAQTQNDQIGMFRQNLVDFTYLRETVKKGDRMDLDKFNQILVGLRHLQTRLDKSIAVIQERMHDLQPLMMHRKKDDQKQSDTLDLMDLNGRWFSVTLTSPQEAGSCKKAFTFYDAYVENILDPNFFYCSKFLPAIHRCRTDLLAFRRESAPAPAATTSVDPQPGPQPPPEVSPHD